MLQCFLMTLHPLQGWSLGENKNKTRKKMNDYIMFPYTL